MNLLEIYARKHKELGFTMDESQQQTILKLSRIYQQLNEQNSQNQQAFSWLDKLKKTLNSDCFSSNSKKKNTVKGLYLWGGVGRGKSHLVDVFFDALPFENKLRMHFYHFMQRIHLELKTLSGEVDPLCKVAENIANEACVICFDEFFVSDITDAMLLAGLLDALFARGVCLVATSNISPKKLYQHGLQRARFLPAIALIEQHCEVFHLQGQHDYRLRSLEQADLYYFPLNESTDAKLAHCFELLASGKEIRTNFDISINGRKLPVIKASSNAIQFDFSTLCLAPRNAADFIKIADQYWVVFVCNVPEMNAEMEDAARRFLMMVDEFYDRKIKLVLSAQVPLFQLYQGEKLTFEFQRCYSRLQEMQSHEYLISER